jgi:hypothetical protein
MESELKCDCKTLMRPVATKYEDNIASWLYERTEYWENFMSS